MISGLHNRHPLGLLFLRDLVMVDPDDRIEVSTVTNYYKHQLKEVDENTKLDDMLETFKVYLLYIILYILYYSIFISGRSLPLVASNQRCRNW